MERTCGSRSFKALATTQFVSAFSDNLFKVIVSFYAIQVLVGAGEVTRFVSIIGILFILPFVVFSPFGGYLADRFYKRNVIVVMFGVKVLLALLACWGLYQGNLWFLSAMLFLFESDSALFSPSRAGLLAELLNEEEISKGNGYMQMVTFVGIILGTALGGVLFNKFHSQLYIVGFFMTALMIIGFMVSNWIKLEKVEKEFTKKNIYEEFGLALKGIYKDQGLFLTMMALAFFNFIGTIFQMNILVYGPHVLHVGEIQISFLLLAVSFGIALGSILAGAASEGKVELGLVPLGALGISIMTLMLGLNGHYYAVICFLFILGICGGFYTVPLNAFFQQYAPAKYRGMYLSVLGIVTASGSLVAGGFLWLVGGQAGVTADKVFIICSGFALMATALILVKLPIALLRLVIWLLVHTAYKLKTIRSECVPEHGGALLISNHISYVDAVLIAAALKRPVRFMMARKVYELPFLNVIFRIAKVIPIDKDEGPKAIIQALTQAREAIQQGELVCIFPEGVLTRTGNMLPFNKGFEHIMKHVDAPIIPLYLDNIWPSIFSYSKGKFFWKLPRFTLYPVSIVFGQPMPAAAKAHDVRQTVQELGAEANILRGAWRKKLHLAFIDEVKRHPFKFSMADSMGLEFNYARTFAAVVSLSRIIFPKHRRPMETNEMVGVLLPSSCMGAIANLAVAFPGKVPVNLNFTLSKEAFDSCVKQCNMRTIITSKAFIEKLGMTPIEGMVYLEDLKQQISPLKSAAYFLSAILLPKEFLSNLYVKGDKSNVDDVATVIFSSGSTGEPKGVMLTHGNIFSNIENFYQVFNIQKDDVVIAALPFFHSFGFTATMCFPLGTAVGVVFHTNPLDASTIGKMALRYKATILMGTPTFMSAYIKKCTQEQFAHLRMALVGAEKLKESLAGAFKEKFGIMPMEGYGATELSPIAMAGIPDYVIEATNERQVGNKFGMVGNPIPGVAAKIVDPDTFETKGSNENGLLLIKGANVMKGYLNNPIKTAEVIKNGWYITGDIAAMDEDGFIKITDRLSRFSKIAGEMVPHIKIEENIMEAIGAIDAVVAVTSVADEKKGERLIVLHTVDIDIEFIIEFLTRKGIPNLWIPKKDSFYKVDTIPLLGTGKVDLKKIKTLAQELVQKESL